MCVGGRQGVKRRQDDNKGFTKTQHIRSDNNNTTVLLEKSYLLVTTSILKDVNSP